MLQNAKRIHLIGIGGIGVSALARILLGDGYQVQGSDIRESSITEALRKEGAKITIGHHPSNLDGADLVVLSTAIPKENVELVEAKKRGIRVMHRSEILNALISNRTVIGVTGTHGKGTVSSMITWILECCGWDPGFVIGGYLNNFHTNAKSGGGKWMVVEVDESDGTHQNFNLDYVVCNYLEVDHLNYYKDLDDIIGTMTSFLNKNKRLKGAFLNEDCAGVRKMIEALNFQPVTYSIEGRVADYEATIEKKDQFPTTFTAKEKEGTLGEFELNIPGIYNVTNALAAIAVTHKLGASVKKIREALAAFKGLENRFTIRKGGNFTIVKDYISHPTGMRKVIESAKVLTKGKTIAVFKPYRYTLINYLKDEYGAAFDGCDLVIISKMYAAEEDPIPGVDTMTIVDKIRENGIEVKYLEDQNDIPDFLETVLSPGDQVIFFGGDDYFRMADAWCDKLDAELQHE